MLSAGNPVSSNNESAAWRLLFVFCFLFDLGGLVLVLCGCRQGLFLGQRLVGGGRHHGGIELDDFLLRLVMLAMLLQISDERREGKEWVSSCRSRWSPNHEEKTRHLNT